MAQRDKRKQHRGGEDTLDDNNGTSDNINNAEAQRKKSKPTIQHDVAELGKQFVSQVQDLKNSDGYLVAPEFNRLPSKKLYADYYNTIKEPISLHEIKEKLKKAQYSSAQDILSDVQLMCSNAQSYNELDSPVYNAAGQILEFAHSLLGNKTADIKQVHQGMLEIIDELISEKDPDSGRQYGDIFLKEPSKRDYPEYYEVIQHPMSFNTLRKNIKADKYPNWESFEQDTNLIFSNAKAFNEEASQVYEDASILESNFQNIFNAKRQQIGEPSQPIKIKLSLGPGRKEEHTPKIKLSFKQQPEQEVEQEQEQEQEQEEQEQEPVKSEEEKVPSKIRIPAMNNKQRRRTRGRPPSATRSQEEQVQESGSDQEASEIEEASSIEPSSDLLDTKKEPSVEVEGESNNNNNTTASTTMLPPPPSDVSGTRASPATPSRASTVETRHREPGQSIKDALITNITLSTRIAQGAAIPPTAYRPPSSTTTTMSSDEAPPQLIFDFPASDEEIFQSFSLTIPSTQRRITMTPTLTQGLLTRAHNLIVTHNGERKSPSNLGFNNINSSSTTTDDDILPFKTNFEFDLIIGLNLVECIVQVSNNPIAARPLSTRHFGSANYLSSHGIDGGHKERFVFWILLAAAPR